MCMLIVKVWTNFCKYGSKLQPLLCYTTSVIMFPFWGEWPLRNVTLFFVFFTLSWLFLHLVVTSAIIIAIMKLEYTKPWYCYLQNVKVCTYNSIGHASLVCRHVGSTLVLFAVTLVPCKFAHKCSIPAPNDTLLAIAFHT